MIKLSHVKYLILACFIFLSKYSNAQLGFCQGNSGAPIFEETFGTGLSNGPPLPVGTTTYGYWGQSNPQDGQYTLASSTFLFGWNLPSDHTPGDTNGKALIVNASTTPGEFYKTNITGLCENTTYEFSSWLINILPLSGCGGNGIPVNVKFEIWDITDSNLLASGDTGNIFSSVTPAWEQYGLVFQTLSGQTSVILKMKNNGVGGCGNDLAIDDIVFKSCGDLIITEDSSGNNSETICTSETPYSEIITAIPDNTVFNSHFYQWQSTTDGVNWFDISGETNEDLSITGLTVTTSFRAKVAEFASNLTNLDCITFSDIYDIQVLQSPSVPVSGGDVDFGCGLNNATLEVSVPTGISVDWYDAPNNGMLLQSSSNVLTVTSQGTYFAEAVNLSNGCVSVTRIAVNANLIPPEDASFTFDANCNGATANITGDIGGSFIFNPDLGDGAIINNTTGEITNGVPGSTYFVEYTTGGACPESSIQNVTVLDIDDSSFTVTVTCDGALVDQPLATPGGLFTFNPAPTDGATIDPVTGTVTGGTSGSTYTIEYTTTGACPSTGVQTFTSLAIDDPSFAMDATCDGGTAINVAEPGGTFGFSPSPTDTAIIDPNTGEVSLATPGASYTVVYTTSGICPSSSTEVLTVLMLDDPSFTLGPTCDGAVATVTGDTGGTFSFSPDPGDGALLDTSTGAITNGTSGSTYTLEYTTSGDCPQSSTQSVTVTAEDDASFTVVPTCDGGTALPGATTTAGGIYTFDVPPTDGASIDPITGEVTGGTPSTTYTVTYGTIGVCATSETVTFTSLAIDDASFTVDPTCDGGTATITGAMVGTFAFDLLPTDGASIDPATGEVTGGTPGETYSIEYTTSGICPNSSIVTFTANPLPTVVAPTALEVCDDGTPDGQTSIDLGLKDGEITGNDPGYAVSYHFDLADAQAGANALPVPYDNISNPQTVHVRVEDTSTGCYDTTTLELVVEQAPVTFDPEPLRYCDPDNDGFGFFTLTDADVEITGGALGLTVTYHETPENAESGSDAIDTLLDYGNITADMQTLYARVESATIATDCYTIEELELIVEPTPQLLEPEALEECDDISADGLAQFDLTSVEAEVLVAGQDPMDYVFSYYDDETDANGAVNAIAVPTAYTNTLAFSQTIWVRVDDPNTVAGCYKLTELELMVNPLPLLTAPSPLELCDDNDPGDEQEAFNLEGASAEILNGQGGITLTYHQTQVDADSGSSPITGPYANMSNPQTIFVRGENVFGCVAFTTVTIRVLPIPTPTPSDQIPSIELCDETVINDGLEVFDLTENEILILNGEAGVTPTYHTTPEDADAGTNAIADPANYTNEGTGVTETIYVRVTNDVTGCFTVVNFGIRVNPLPEVVVVTDFILCELNTDGFGAFDLESKDGEVLGGQDPLQFAVSYHTSLADAEAGANALLSPYTNTSNPQEIFVTITDTSTGCTISSQRFDIEVQESAQANPDMDAILYEECDDNMEVDGNPANDSLQFDLSTQDAQVLDGQDPAGYTVTYFATEAEANLNVSPLPVLYQNIANPQTIYARVDNTSTICFAVAPLTLQVNPLPAFDLDPSYILCVNTNGSEAFDPLVLDTGLSASNYGFEWSLNGTVIAGATGPSLMPQQGGSYSVTVTDTSTSTVTSCSTTDTTDVVESEPPVLVVDVVTQAFAENHVIEATAGGPGDYEYSLDGGPWQDSGTFVNVSPGGHEVTARDKNGCGSVTEPVFVIDYPLYFTPNGDGNHDTWNIVGIGSTAKIYIFDRYGKLLKQISPTGSGWDGTYNGNSMPSSDYWFTVEYDEPITNQRKELKAHFTLKR